MKVLVLSTALLALVLSACAEPPRYRQRQAAYAAPPPAEAAGGPYPPSGWRPSGREFSLPVRQAPKDQYGPPPPPPAAYGPPSTEAPTTTDTPTTTDSNTEETTEITTEDPQENEFNNNNNNNEARATAVAVAETGAESQLGGGVYYVLLPDGRLQRVAYSTSRDTQQLQRLVAPPQPLNAGFLAIQYQDVQPIQAPIYAYGNPLVRLLK